MSTVHALPVHVAFNQSAFSQFINSTAGRLVRVAAGVAFLVVGYAYRTHAAGIAAIAWGVLPLSAGAIDLCYISAMLGGPLSGARIRALRSTALPGSLGRSPPPR